jgi:Phosphotransferase enzyme family
VTPPIPVELEDITAEWCTAIFQRHAPGAVVGSTELIEAHSGTTGRARIALDCVDVRVPASVFVKLAPFIVERRGFVDEHGMGVSEARFYAEVSQEVPVRSPAVWYAAHDDNRRYIMVLEDLVAAGARFPRDTDTDIAAFAEGVIDNFARLHAAFHGCERFTAGGDLSWIEERTRGYGSAAGLVQLAVGQIGDAMPPSFHRLVEAYVPRADRIAELLALGDRTLVHGDAHIGNMFVVDAAPGFLDWAVLGFAPGMRDVAYFMGNSVSTEFRRLSERDLVDRYCRELAAGGVALSPVDAWEQYRLQMITSWVAAVVTAGFGSALQPIDVAMRATERANSSVEDLEVADALLAHLG